MHTLYVGFNDKDQHIQVLDDAAFYEAIAREIESFTAFEAVGYYKGEREKSLKLEVFEKTHAELVAIAKRLCVELNQETIIVDGEFVTA